MSANERNPGRDISLRSRHEIVDWAFFFVSKIHLGLFELGPFFFFLQL